MNHSWDCNRFSHPEIILQQNEQEKKTSFKWNRSSLSWPGFIIRWEIFAYLRARDGLFCLFFVSVFSRTLVWFDAYNKWVVPYFVINSSNGSVFGHENAQDGERVTKYWGRHRVAGYSLTVKQLGCDDQGTYLCRAINGFGVNEIAFHLDVFGERRRRRPAVSVNRYLVSKRPLTTRSLTWNDSIVTRISR